MTKRWRRPALVALLLVGAVGLLGGCGLGLPDKARPAWETKPTSEAPATAL